MIEMTRVAPITAETESRIGDRELGMIAEAEPQRGLDAIAALAARLFEMPVAGIALLDTGGDWTEAGGAALPDARRAALAIFGPLTLRCPSAPLIITDAAADPRLPVPPAGSRAPGFGFYAGLALRGATGQQGGILYLLDTVPRPFGAGQIALLRDLASCANALLDLRRSVTDLTEIQAHHRQALASRSLLPWVADRDGALLPASPGIAAAYRPCPKGLDAATWLLAAHPDDRRRAEARWADSVASLQPFDHELRVRITGGAYRWCQCRAAPRRDEAGAIQGWHGTLEDVTQLHAQAEKLRYLADHDALTGLCNRTRINHALAQHRAEGSAPLALFKLDLDNLRGVNATLGMAAGDTVLCAAAQRLRACLRPDDLLGRTDGDEFMLLAVGVGRREEAAILAARIQTAFEAPVLIDGQPLAIGVSVGIALWPQDGDDPDTLLPNAALALLRAKAEGQATFRFFRAQTDETMRTRQALVLDLAEALPRGELALAFQPQFDLRSAALTGFEVLLRWHHPSRGSIPADAFVPLAESSGLIVPIGRWVLEQACRAAVLWPNSVSVAVNLSSKQFDGGGELVWIVATALAGSGLAASRLELEVTESLPLLQDGTNLETLRQLRALGVRIALDDFGSGYSSLAYLQCFAFDKLKIDRTIVSRLADADTSRAILRAIVGMSRSLGMQVTAEGVESAAQGDWLREAGCDQVQGFFYGTPLAPAELAPMIAARAA